MDFKAYVYNVYYNTILGVLLWLTVVQDLSKDLWLLFLIR